LHAITICFYAYKCYGTHTIPSYLIFALWFSPCIISLYNMISMLITKLVMDSPMPTSSYMENLVCPYTNSTSSFLLFPLHYFYIIIPTLSSSLFLIHISSTFVLMSMVLAFLFIKHYLQWTIHLWNFLSSQYFLYLLASFLAFTSFNRSKHSLIFHLRYFHFLL